MTTVDDYKTGRHSFFRDFADIIGSPDDARKSGALDRMGVLLRSEQYNPASRRAFAEEVRQHGIDETVISELLGT